MRNRSWNLVLFVYWNVWNYLQQFDLFVIYFDTFITKKKIEFWTLEIIILE